MTPLEIAWTVIGILVPILIGAGLSVVGYPAPEFRTARACFWASALLLGGMDIVWSIKTPHSYSWRAIVGGLVWAAILLFLPVGLKWIREKEIAVSSKHPSFVFVFGAPLGDNNSAIWIMMLEHYGPDPAYSCDIGFSDDDRKNIEHQWLVEHPDTPFPPPRLAAGESQTRANVLEVGPEGSAGSFSWKPLDPDRQHYTVSISCRDGVFVEKWEVTRVNGILRSRITIERGPQWIKKNPGRDPVVFRLEDPEFMSTPLATAIPKSSTAKVVHPGWKPKHRFEIPAAIIDPNGHVQVVSGIKLADGSTLTDFGCWNILTKHFGDEPAERI